MGQGVSSYPQTPPNFPYFTVTFRQYDTIKLCDADTEVAEIFDRVITENWTGGIQRRYVQPGNEINFKLTGYPFGKGGWNGRSMALETKTLCCHLLMALRHAGWELMFSSDLSRYIDLSTLFFQRRTDLIGRYLHCIAPLSLPYNRPTTICCLSLSSYSKLQLINASQSLQTVLENCASSLCVGKDTIGTALELHLRGYMWINASCDQDESAMGETRFCVLSLNSNDRIRLIGCPNDLDAKQYDKFFEYKMRGYPWNCSGDTAVFSRQILTIIMQNLVTIGWAVLTALDVSRRVTDKAVFILRSCTPSSIAHFCIAPADVDKLRLINADKQMIEIVGNVIRNTWTIGIQCEGVRAVGYEWKLGGYPWSASQMGGTFTLTRQLMVRIVNELARLGWRVICSGDVSAKYIHRENAPDHPVDVHSLFVAYTGHAPVQNLAIGFVPAPGMPSTSASAPPSYDEAMNIKKS